MLLQGRLDFAVHHRFKHFVGGHNAIGLHIRYGGAARVGVDISARLHIHGGFAHEVVDGGLVIVVACPIGSAAVGVAPPELVQVIPVAGLHGACEHAAVVGLVRGTALTVVATGELLKEGIQTGAEMRRHAGFAYGADVVPFGVDAFCPIPSRIEGVVVGSAIGELNLFRTGIQQELHPLAGFPQVTLQADAGARAFAAEAGGNNLFHAAFALGACLHHAAALVGSKGGVGIGVAVIPDREDDGAVVVAAILAVVLYANIAAAEPERLHIGSVVVGIGGNEHFVVDPVEGSARGQAGIRGTGAVQVERRDGTPGRKEHVGIGAGGIGGRYGEVFQHGGAGGAAGEFHAIPSLFGRGETEVGGQRIGQNTGSGRAVAQVHAHGGIVGRRDSKCSYRKMNIKHGHMPFSRPVDRILDGMLRRTIGSFHKTALCAIRSYGNGPFSSIYYLHEE